MSARASVFWPQLGGVAQRPRGSETNTRAIPVDAFEKRGVASNGSSSPSLHPFSVPLCSCVQHLVQPYEVEDSVQATPPSKRRCCLEMLDNIEPLTPSGPHRHDEPSSVSDDVATATVGKVAVEADACCTDVSVFMESSCTRKPSESSVPRIFSKSTDGEGGAAHPVKNVKRDTMSLTFGDDAKRAASISHLDSGRFFGCKDLNRALEARDMNRVRALLRSPYLVVSAEVRMVAKAVSNSEMVSDQQEI